MADPPKRTTIKKSTLAYTIKDDDRAIFARLSRSHQNHTDIIHFFTPPQPAGRLKNRWLCGLNPK